MTRHHSRDALVQHFAEQVRDLASQVHSELRCLADSFLAEEERIKQYHRDAKSRGLLTPREQYAYLSGLPLPPIEERETEPLDGVRPLRGAAAGRAAA